MNISKKEYDKLIKDSKMCEEFKDALDMFKSAKNGMVLFINFKLLFKPYPAIRKWFKEERK